MEERVRIPCRSSVRCYPYRTATVQDVVATLPRTGPVDTLENELARLADVMKSNHAVYSVTTPQGSKLHFLFSDYTVTIGLSVEEGRW